MRNYEAAEIEVIRFEIADVITTSGDNEMPDIPVP